MGKIPILNPVAKTGITFQTGFMKGITGGF